MDDSNIVAYGGVHPGPATDSPVIAGSTCGFYPPGDDFYFCLLQSLLENVFLMPGDGIVPYSSAVYSESPSGDVRVRKKIGYDHFDMVEGYNKNSSDSLFTDIKNDLFSALPGPVAKLTMSYGGKVGSENSPLTVTIPKGTKINGVSFSSVGSTGSITAYEWKVDGVVSSSSPSFFSYDPLGAGTHDVRLKVTDGLGRTDYAFGSLIVQEQSSPAILPSVTTNVASQVTTTSAILNGQLATNASSATVWFQWGTTTNYGQSTSAVSLFSNISTPIAWALSGLLPNTPYHFRIVAQNQAGVKYGQDQTFTTVLSLDTVAPSISITSPTSGPTYSTGNGSVSLAGFASDDRAVTSVTWVNDRGGSGTAAGTTNWTISSVFLSAGANVITVTAWDAAANQRSAVLTVTSMPPDNVSPTTMILNGPSGTWPSSSFTFTWAGSDNLTPIAGLLYTTYLDGYDASSTPYSSATSRSFSGVPNGTYTFWVRALDSAGNVDSPEPAAHSR